jgi:hypothetical protein
VKKNQGNNFPNVVAVFPTGDTEKFDKQLMYTAVAPVTDTLFMIVDILPARSYRHERGFLKGTYEVVC